MSVAFNYAWRTLLRSSSRTLVSILGLALGGMVALVALAWIRGESNMIAESTAMSGQGYLQVLPKGWKETRDGRLRIAHFEPIQQVVESEPGVTVVAPQVETQSLLGMGIRVSAVSLLGVDAEVEPKIRRAARGITGGRYLERGDDQVVVVGAELARRLDVELGDELVVSAVTPAGDMNSALLMIVGILSSGSREMDAGLAHVPLQTAIRLGAREGVSRLSMLVQDESQLEEVRARLQRRIDSLPPDVAQGAQVLTWTEVNPAMVAAEKSDAAFSNAIIAVVTLLIILGVTSAQLTGVLQRGRELSVLLALGMRRRRLWRLIFTEAVLMGLAGGVLSLLLAAAPLWYLSQVGVDLRAFAGEDGMTMGNIMMNPVMKADVGLWLLAFGLGLSLVASLLGAIYPALWSLRIDPASVLRSRN